MDPISVNRPFLPPINEYIEGLSKIWQSNQLTNGGQFSAELANMAAMFFRSPHVSLYSNATLALISCLKCLDLSRGRIITSPFTFAATAQSIIWSGCTPVFVDIDPISLNISNEQVFEAASEDAVAILPVHVFGNLVDTGPLEDLRSRYGTRILIDAAHAFGNSDDHLRSIASADASVISLHATKMFNSVEGGVVLTSDKQLHDRLERFKNFGLHADGVPVEVGFNAKMSELHALMGVAQFKYIESIEEDRRRISNRYIERLSSVSGNS